MSSLRVLPRLLAAAFGFFTALASERTAAADPETLTLEEAVSIAQSRTRDVIRARADLLLADVEKVRALSFILPRVDLGLSATEQFGGSPIVEARNTRAVFSGLPGEVPGFAYGPFIEGQANNYSNPQFDLSLRGRQLIYDGGRWWTVIAQAKDLGEQRKAALRTVENDVRLEAARRFYELELAQRSVVTFEQQIKVDQDQLLRVKALLQAGMGKLNDVAAVERNLAEDRITLARRSYTERAARRTLNLALGRPADTAVKLAVPEQMVSESAVVEVVLPAKQKLIEDAKLMRPELARANIALELAKKDVLVRRADYYPVVSLVANYTRRSRKPGRIFDDPTQNYYAGLGLELSWNLFSGYATNAAVETAELELTKVEADLEALERTVGGEVGDRLDSVQLFVEVHGLAKQAIRSAEEAVRLARGLYEQGRGTLLELRDAELRLTLARLSLLEARLQLEIAREELRRAVGGEIAGGSP